MCLMRKDNWCMRSYNNCTVQVLDQDTKSKQTDPLEDQTQTRNDLQGGQNETVEAEGPAREGDLNLEFENSDLASTEGSSDSVSSSDSPSSSTEGISDLGSTSDSYSSSTEGSSDLGSTSDSYSVSTEGSSDLGSTSDSYSVSTEGSSDLGSTSDSSYSSSTEGSSDLGSTSDSYSVSTEESTIEVTSSSSVKFEGLTTESVGLGNL
jgi:hypothetical protein